jgi:hypothetical protein
MATLHQRSLRTYGAEMPSVADGANAIERHGAAVCAALSLWFRARRWPFIPARFYTHCQ